MHTKFVISLCSFLFVLSINLKAQERDDKVESQIDSLLSVMTLDEKVALCHAQSKFSVKGVPRLGLPEIWMTDGPHGVRAEISWDSWDYAGWTNDSITAFPALTCLAASFNMDASYEYGKAIGEEALFRKKDVLLGPGVNIYRTPLNGRNFEYMGEDPHLASKMVVPYVKGVQENKVAACVKHYALNNQEKWRSHINVKVSDRALREIYLPAYKAAIQEGGAWSIMGAYNQYNGQYCCHHKVLLNDILKREWGFDGVVITDWGGAHDTKESAMYGLDIEMGTATNGLTYSEKNAYQNYYLARPFRDMIAKGELSEALVDDKARRILRLMMRTNMAENRPRGSLNTKAHQQVARKVGQEGVVLLKNDNEFFPIDPNRKMTIAVIGENATRMMTKGGGSSELKPLYELSPLQGIKERYPEAEILHTLGYGSGPVVYDHVMPSPYNDDSLRTEAVSMAKKADIVLVFGGLNKNHQQDCENGDRIQYGLPFGQEELIKELAKVNDNIGVVLVSGNAVATPWLPQVKGLLQAWYLGSETGHVIADVISGDVNPSGKLPFSFPKKLADNAAHHFGEISYPGDSINQEYKEGILVGYRWHDTKEIEAQFAFGYGLSYTNFKLTGIKTDKKAYAPTDQIIVNCELANTGKKSGAEVVQVYVGKSKSKVERATKELKAFKKVFLDKGKKEKLQLSIKVSDLAYYDEAKAAWEVEKGEYIVYVGNASNQIIQKLKVVVE